ANNRSYTGHEPITLGGDNRIIHMNGRIYDADTGRFMQADPVVQAPSNLQNYNAYSYVLNNPLSYTDPSGYIFKKLAKNLFNQTKAAFITAGFISGGVAGAALSYWAYDRAMNSNGVAAVVSVALNFIPGCQVWCSAAFNAQRTYHKTGSVSASLRAGATSAVTAAAFYGIGQGFEALGAVNGPAHIFAHALTGGIVSDLQGGKFGHGFFSAGLTKGAQVAGLVSMDNVIIGTAQSMVVAGTISKLTGGKFANAAVTGAFQYLYNAVRGKGAAKLGKDLADLLSGRKPTRNEQIVEYAQELMDGGFTAEEAEYRANKRYGVTKKQGSFASEMSAEDASRYNARYNKRAPVESSPYNTHTRYHENGDIKQVTTYDQFGDRHRQYDLKDSRGREAHQHIFDYSNYPRPKGVRSKEHAKIDD
uniref:RHS repeat-associated core domain-containing protein n=1 Tax=Pseudoalteromonas rubra TaxID=43658 RepID=UPI0023E816EE